MARIAPGAPLLRRIPPRFIAGSTLDEAMEAVRALNASGTTATLDVLGESVEGVPPRNASRDRADRRRWAGCEREHAVAERLEPRFPRVSPMLREAPKVTAFAPFRRPTGASCGAYVAERCLVAT